MNIFWQDVLLSLRALKRSASFTTVVIFTVAIGLGANVAIFSLVDAVSLRRLSVEDPQSLYFLVNEGAKGAHGAPPYQCFLAFRENARSFSGMAAVKSGNVTLTVSDAPPEQVWGEYASGSYFDVLGVRPRLGRLLRPSDELLQPPVAVISREYWHTRFSDDPDIVGTAVVINNTPFAIVGVVDDSFRGVVPGHVSAVTVPFTALDRELLYEPHWFFDIVARLRPPNGTATARAELDPIFQNYVKTLPDLAPEMRRDFLQRMDLVSASRGTSEVRNQFSYPLLVLMASVGVMLLIACSNLASLFVARAISNEGNFALRFALGEGKLRVFSRLAIEAALLFCTGGALGLALGLSMGHFLSGTFALGRNPISLDVDLNATILVSTFAVSITAGLLFGAFPAFATVYRHATRATLSLGQRWTTATKLRAITQKSLVVIQIALSLTLLVAGGALVRTFLVLSQSDLGFRPAGVSTLRVAAVDPALKGSQLRLMWSDLLERVQGTPGVHSVGLSRLTPLSGRDLGARLVAPGFEPKRTLDQLVTLNHVSDGYFETLGIHILSGRPFAANDRAESTRVAILNKSAAQFYFGKSSPIGSTIKVAGIDYQVVGIVQDTKHASIRGDAPRQCYVSIAQSPERISHLTLAVRSVNGEPMGSIVRNQLRSLPATSVLVTEVMTLEDQIDAALIQERLLSSLGGAFSILGLVLAATGLYGLLAFLISRRTHEIGIRMALGADKALIMRKLLSQSLLLVSGGVIVGLPLALLLIQPLRSVLYGVRGEDPSILVVSCLVLFMVGLIAAYLPASRAANISPLEALRSE